MGKRSSTGFLLVFLLTLAACASTQGVSEGPSGTALSVSDVINRQGDLIGQRVIIRGVLSECHRLSCVLLGVDGNGRERILSIGSSAAFDAAARRHSGRTVEVEARLTDVCLADPDPDIIPVCADRSDTLADPVFIRAL